MGEVVSGYESEDYLCVGANTMVDGDDLPFSESHPVQNKVSASDDGVKFINGPVLSSEALDPSRVKDPGFIKNNNYSTEYTYTANAITVPVESNFDASGNLTFEWYQEDTKLNSLPISVGNYTLKVTAADNDNYLGTSIDIPVKISYLETDAVAALADTNKGDNGWYKGAVTLNAPSGYTISGDNSTASGFANTYTPSSQMDGNNISISYALRNTAGEITALKSVTVNIDSEPPVISDASVSGVEKTSATITVNASDSLSGIAGYTLNLANGGTMESTDGTFTLSGLTENTSYSYTVTVKDKAGNIASNSGSFTTHAGLVIANMPTLSGEYGTAVEDMVPTGGKVTLGAGGADVGGTWSVSDAKKADVPDVGTKNQYELTFKPSDSSTYEELKVSVTPTVSARSLTNTQIKVVFDPDTTYTFNGNDITPKFSITDEKFSAEIPKSNYDVELSDNKNAGMATLTVNGKNNYTGQITGQFTISKAAAPVLSARTESYINNAGSGGAVTVELAKLMPGNSGTLTYEVSTISYNKVEAGSSDFVTDTKVENGILSYVVGTGSVGDEASFTVTIASTNYATTVYKVTIQLTDKLIVKEKEGQEVKINGSNALTYGKKLSELKLNTGEAVFVSGSEEVSGTLAWEEPDSVPNTAVTAASWIFVPSDSTKYATLRGSVAIIVQKAAPNVTVPVLNNVTYSVSKTLANISLGSSDASWTVGDENVTVSGTWFWKEPGTVPTVDKNTYTAVFTPGDTSNYNSVEAEIPLKVNKATPEITELPTASAIEFGQIVSASQLSGGKAVDGRTEVPGSFAWVNTGEKPAVGAHQLEVKFIPTDTVNYNEVTGVVELTVDKATASGIPAQNGRFVLTDTENTKGTVNIRELIPDDCGDIKYTPSVSAIDFVSDIAIDEANGILTYTVDLESVTENAETSFTVTIETNNYADIVLTINVLISTEKLTVAEKEGFEAAITNNAVYGLKLSDLLLNTETAEFISYDEDVEGTLEWKDGDIVLDEVGELIVKWVFTPDNVNRYEVLEGSLRIVVEKASPIVTAPALSDVTYNASQTLAGISLGSGDAAWTVGDEKVSVSGVWSWKTPATVPTVDKNTYTAVFTPDDTAHYCSVEMEVALNVLKAKDAPGMTDGTSLNVPYSTERVSDVTLPDGWAWDESAKGILLEAGKPVTVKAVYVGEDKNNYENVTVEITITRAQPEAGSADDDDDRDEMTPQEKAKEGMSETIEQGASGQEIRRLGNSSGAQIITSIAGATNFLPSGYYTSEYKTSGSVYDKAVAAVRSNLKEYGEFRVIEVNLFDANDVQLHQLSGMVSVEMPIPEGFTVRNGYVLVVYRINDDGSMTRCTTMVNGNKITFMTNHFSTFVLVEQSKTTASVPATGDNSNLTGYLISLILAVFAMAALWAEYTKRTGKQR